MTVETQYVSVRHDSEQSRPHCEHVTCGLMELHENASQLQCVSDHGVSGCVEMT